MYRAAARIVSARAALLVSWFTSSGILSLLKAGRASTEPGMRCLHVDRRRLKQSLGAAKTLRLHLAQHQAIRAITGLGVRHSTTSAHSEWPPVQPAYAVVLGGG